MARIVLFAIFIFLSVTTSHQQASPLFIIDDNDVLTDVQFKSNPFARIYADDFELIVQKALTKAAKIVIFLEKEMSNEDLATKDSKGTPFQKLRSGLKLGIVKYHPAVVTPYRILSSLIKQNQINTYSLGRFSMTNNPNFINNKMKSLYVVFNDDKNENNIERLKRHDTQIMEIFKYIRRTTLGNVVGFFTGKNSHYQPSKSNYYPRKISNATISKEKHKIENPYLVIRSNGAMYKLRGLSKTSKSQPSRLTRYDRPAAAETSEAISTTDLNSVISFGDFDLMFSFSIGPKVWKLDSISLIDHDAEVGRTILGFQSIWNTSYICFDPIDITNFKDGSIVTIAEYQIEPRYSMYQIAIKYGDSKLQPVEKIFAKNSLKDNIEYIEFSRAEHCGPFYTPAILAATLVVAVMIFITSGGIIALLDLKTNNKFDDVNVTKRLTIIEN